MRNLFLGVMTFAFLYAGNCAAQAPDEDAPSKILREKIVTHLGFTDPLADSIISIKRDFRTVILHVRTNQGLNSNDKKVLFEGINLQMDEKLLAVLGTENFRKFKDWDSKNWWRME